MVDIKNMQARSIIVSPRSPTFNTYSSDNVSEIAARVVQESRQEHSYPQEFMEEKDNDDDDDFEFAVVCNKDPDMFPVSADEIFYKGQIKPTYPLFNNNIDRIPKPRRTHRLPLGKLMMSEEERETTSFWSSGEADELDRVKPGTYCVWTPKAANKNKSNTSGRSSKRWKLRDLLYTTSNTDQTCNKDIEIPEKFKEEAYEEEHGNRDMKPGDMMMMRTSILPNRHDLVGIYSNINGLGRNLHPF